MSDQESNASFQDAESNQEIDYLKNSARGYRGALTRRLNIAKSHIRIAGDDPSSDSVADLRRSKDEIQKAFQKLEDAYTLVQETEPKLFQECQDTLDKGVKEMTDVIDKINTTLKKSTHCATPRVSDPPMALANPSTRDTPHAIAKQGI